jgi:hypothetical protein
MLNLTYSNIPPTKLSLVRWIAQWLATTWGTPIKEDIGNNSTGLHLSNDTKSIFLPIQFNTPKNETLNNENFFDNLIFWLSGEVESTWETNSVGHHDIKNQHQLDVIKNAHLSAFSELLKKQLFPNTHILEPKWPHNKQWAVCLTHDVDYPEVYRLIEPLRILKRNGLKNTLQILPGLLSGKRHHWHFPLLTELEKQFKQSSAFYFCPVQGNLLAYLLGRPDPFYDVFKEKFRDVFTLLKENDFEIGMHASFLAHQSEKKMKEEKEILEEACQTEIKGLRHHYWRLGNSPEKTLKLHSKAGFLYDTSIGLEKYLGWRRGVCFPYNPIDTENNEKISTLQLGNTWMDDHFFSYLDINTKTVDQESSIPQSAIRKKALENTIEKVKSIGGLMVVDTHEYPWDNKLFSGWKEIYEYFLNKLSSASDVWSVKPSELATYWNNREKNLLGKSQLLGL